MTIVILIFAIVALPFLVQISRAGNDFPLQVAALLSALALLIGDGWCVSSNFGNLHAADYLSLALNGAMVILFIRWGMSRPRQKHTKAQRIAGVMGGVLVCVTVLLPLLCVFVVLTTLLADTLF